MTEHYLDVFDRVAASGLDAHVSVKPTQLGLDLDRALCERNLDRLMERAEQRNNFVWIDMESSPYVDPTLDLWVTAKPFLERWMENRIGLAAVRRRFLAEAPYLAAALPELPRLLHQRLDAPPVRSDPAILLLASTQRSTNRLLAIIAVLLLGLVGFIGALLLGVALP